MPTDPTPSLQDRLKAAIEKGEIIMKPRWRYVLPSLLALSGLVLLLLVVLYLSSFSVFVMRQTGLWTLPPQHFGEVRTLFFALPWMLVCLVLACLAVLYVLLRRYALSYSHPLVYSVGAVLLVAVAGGVALGHTPLHPFLYEQARQDHLPFAGRMYRGYEAPLSRDVAVGTVSDRTGSGFTLLERDGSVVVTITAGTRIPREGVPMEGEVVVVMGEREEGEIEAFGIRTLRDGLSRPTPRFRRLPPPTRAFIPEPR